MKINRVYSYMDGWTKLLSSRGETFEEIVGVLDQMSLENLSKSHVTRRFKGRSDKQPIYSPSLGLASKYFLKKQGWVDYHEAIQKTNQSPHGVKDILCKNEVSIKLITNCMKPLFANWLVYETPIMFCTKLSEISVLLVPGNDVLDILKDKNKDNILTHGKCQMLLRQLSPLKSNAPFAVIGFSCKDQPFDPDIYEITPSNNSIYNNSISVERSLSFTNETYKAGIGIIAEFSDYLQKNFPNEDVSIRIEQENNKNIKLVIESLKGDPIVIDKALNEYGSKISESKILPISDAVLQNNSLNAEVVVAGLLEAIKIGLQHQSPPIVNVSSTSSAQNLININQNISGAIGSVNELLEAFQNVQEQPNELKELHRSLDSIEREKNPEVIRKSGTMNKFKRIMDRLQNQKSKLHKTVTALDSGIALAKDLCNKYNNIAEWCGLPTIPKFFLGKKI